MKKIKIEKLQLDSFITTKTKEIKVKGGSIPRTFYGYTGCTGNQVCIV